MKEQRQKAPIAYGGGEKQFLKMLTQESERKTKAKLNNQQIVHYNTMTRSKRGSVTIGNSEVDVRVIDQLEQEKKRHTNQSQASPWRGPRFSYHYVKTRDLSLGQNALQRHERLMRDRQTQIKNMQNLVQSGKKFEKIIKRQELKANVMDEFVDTKYQAKVDDLRQSNFTSDTSMQNTWYK